MENEKTRQKTKMPDKKFFPLFVDLTEKKAVVIGGGKIGTRRAKALLPFVGSLVVEAPDFSTDILDMDGEGKLVLRQKAYERQDIYDADLVVAATDDEKVNEDIYSACKCLGILVNVVSDQKKCDFHFPGLLEYEGVVLGFNGAGKDHSKVKEVRIKTEQALKGSREGKK